MVDGEEMHGLSDKEKLLDPQLSIKKLILTVFWDIKEPITINFF